MEDGRIVRPASAPKLTYDDFMRFPDDGLRHELIDGEHYVTPSPATIHQRLVGRLHVILHEYLRQHPIGEVFLAPFDVVLSNHDIVEPDLLVILDDQVDILTEKHVRGAPALVIEVLSPGTRRRDERLKRDLYSRARVREYWIVDPDGLAIDVWTRGSAGTFDELARCQPGTGQPFVSRLFPEVVFDLASLFRSGS